MKIVVKIGSSSLVDGQGAVLEATLSAIVDDIAAAVGAGHQVIVVSSGAIATGLGILGKSKRPKDLPSLQAASAVGQGALFAIWSKLFLTHQLTAAQVLFTMHDVSYRSSYINARNTLTQLVSWGAIPIVNENDTTATDEITFGDNDTLAAQVAVSLGADTLILLTDTDGLYTAHPDEPGSEKIECVDDHSLLHRIDTARAGSHWGSGGMRSKVIAAEMASVGGTATFIAHSAAEQIVSRIGSGEHIGTKVVADKRRGSSFKLWLRYAKQAAGVLHIDEGCEHALVKSGASLLPIGIASVTGEFQVGDAVTIVTVDGREIGKGICEYSASELSRLVSDRDLARGAEEAVHRDELVMYDALLAL